MHPSKGNHDLNHHRCSPKDPNVKINDPGQRLHMTTLNQGYQDTNKGSKKDNAD
ncbi:Uncharacterised protein [Chlamydia trachomatis]|nr:Uncharacterised protein [Chlamydia trachomatis]